MKHFYIRIPSVEKFSYGYLYCNYGTDLFLSADGFADGF